MQSTFFTFDFSVLFDWNPGENEPLSRDGTDAKNVPAAFTKIFSRWALKKVKKTDLETC